MVAVITYELTIPVDATISVKVLLPEPRSLNILYVVIDVPPLLGEVQPIVILVADYDIN